MLIPAAHIQMMLELSVEVLFSCKAMQLCSYSNCHTSYHTIIMFKFAAAPCEDGEVQLVGDRRYRNYGRVEVCINSSWSSLCGINATHKVASVTCKQLGLSPQGNIHISGS